MKSTWMTLAMLTGLVLGAGCAPTQLSENYGESYYTMMESQILNPEAGRTQDPVEGMDGKASMTATEQYRKSFEERDANFGQSMVSTGVRSN